MTPERKAYLLQYPSTTTRAEMNEFQTTIASLEGKYEGLTIALSNTKSELEKWRKKGSPEQYSEMKEQIKINPGSLAAKQAYINALEHHIAQLQIELENCRSSTEMLPALVDDLRSEILNLHLLLKAKLLNNF